MNITIENIMLIGSILLLISIIAGKTSYRFGVPTLLLFLVVGMLAGTDGIGGIIFNDPKIAQFIGIVSLNFILFSGGLDTDWKSVKPVLWPSITLSSIGVILTAVLLGLFVWVVTDFTLYESLLLGSIVSSTDAAAVFSLLRSKSLALKHNLRPALEMESGSNDPMAYVLTILFLGLVLAPDKSFASVIPLFFQQMIFGGAAGILMGKLSKVIINGIKLDYEALYPVLVIALMFITFALTDLMGGNGFLAIYICAVYLGNQNLIHKRTILQMYDGFAWLMQIVLFLTLGLLVFPSAVIPYIGVGLLISFFLIIIARPVSVFLTLLPFKIKVRDKLFISWVGLRGAVPIVFATYPLLAGIEKADMIFNIVFFVAVSSVLIQGTSIHKVAKLLHLALPERVKKKNLVERLLNDYPRTAMDEITLGPTCIALDKRIVELSFPRSSIIAMIRRDDKFITPNGSTLLKEGDMLIVLSENKEGLEEVYQTLGIGGAGRVAGDIAGDIAGDVAGDVVVKESGEADGAADGEADGESKQGQGRDN